MKLRHDEPETWCSTYCNRGHKMATGRPVGHECYIIPPRLLRLERDAMGSDASPEERAESAAAWLAWSKTERRTVRPRAPKRTRAQIDQDARDFDRARMNRRIRT